MKFRVYQFVTAPAILIAVSCSLNAETIFGMTASASGSLLPGIGLVSFDSTNPGTINSVGNFTGLVSGHGLRSIDFRPSTGQLYAISNNGAAAQIYTVDITTAALTSVGSGFVLTGNTTNRIEMDFNPVTDWIRIITGASRESSLENNFIADPASGALSAAANLFYASGDAQSAATNFSIIGAAHSNNFAGATTTTLYAWEYNTDALNTIGGIDGSPSPDTGAMNTVNLPSSAMTGNAGLGMDISGASGTLYATHDNPNAFDVMGLYSRELSTGLETFIGAYGAGIFISDISVMPIPEPSSALLGGLAACMLAARRRRDG